MRRTRLSRWLNRAAAGLTAMAGLAAAACSQALPNPVSSPAPSSPSSSPQPQETASPIVTGAVAPLTGLPASAADAAKPAVALAVAGADPHGLTSADVVFEEITTPVRYLAVFQSRQASGVGPITGTQPADRAALAVLHPLIGYDGATAGYFVKILDKSKKIRDEGFASHPSLYTAAAQGITASTRKISGAARGVPAPPPLFQYQGPGAGALAATGVFRLTSVRLSIPGSGTQEWSFSSHADRWTLTRGGPKVAVSNLVVQTVPYKQITVNRRTGVVVSNAQVIGTGRAEVFAGSAPGGSGGSAAIGTWSKPRSDDVTNYFDASKSPMAFTPGPTWIVLAPSGTHVSTSGEQR